MVISKVLLGVFALAARASDESCALQVQAASKKEDADWGYHTVKKINTTYITETDVIPEVLFGSGNDNGGFAVTQVQFTEFQLARRGKFMKIKGSMSELEVDPEEAEVGSTAGGYYGRGRGRRGGWWKRSVKKTLDRINKKNEMEANQWTGCVELGLRAKQRFNVPSNDFRANGTTYGEFGIDGENGCNCRFGFAPTESAACWNFEFSINTNFCGTGDLVLSDLNYSLCVYRNDTGKTNASCLDHINSLPCADHQMGNNSFGNGEGVKVDCSNAADPAAEYQALLSQYNVAQNSWNTLFDQPPIVWNDDITGDGAYIVSLSASKDMPGRYGSTISVPIGETAITVLQTASTGGCDPPAP
eukprot:CAMPEP_0181485578 /NCGR_PEP_ID=MMETSP1110-20121109/46649_1 /TAXON_ID=174948 /ORGANISM="Symbiodinium sp., Strain CCMP421" /LENGTH=358 /DNA_ID=CAMNT_0023611605 /DNA_START=54 /DNA_END=1130 /DNA_ORIENTATION=-